MTFAVTGPLSRADAAAMLWRWLSDGLRKAAPATGLVIIVASVVPVTPKLTAVVPDPTPAFRLSRDVGDYAPIPASLPAVGSAQPALNYPGPPSLTGDRLAPHDVFGFLPYWLLDSAPDLSNVSTVAYFGVNVNSDGSLFESGTGWAGYQSPELASVISNAHAQGTQVVLTAKNFNTPSLHQLYSDPANADRLSQQLIQVIGARNMDGVNLDFEGSGSADRAALVSFVASVSRQLHAANPRWQVTICTYTGSAGDPNSYFDVASLAPYVDAMFVMAYDMIDFTHASPNAPLDSYDILMSQYARAVPPQKVIWGMPFYGYEFPTADSKPGSAATANPRPLSYGEISAAHLPVFWDSDHSVPWTAYQDSGQWYEIYYDNPGSLTLKANLMGHYHLRGAGIWTLGMNGGDPTMMAALMGGARPNKSGAAGPPAQPSPTPSPSPRPGPSPSPSPSPHPSPSPNPVPSPSPLPSPKPVPSPTPPPQPTPTPLPSLPIP